jgi:hypothetical protein
VITSVSDGKPTWAAVYISALNLELCVTGVIKNAHTDPGGVFIETEDHDLVVKLVVKF